MYKSCSCCNVVKETKKKKGHTEAKTNIQGGWGQGGCWGRRGGGVGQSVQQFSVQPENRRVFMSAKGLRKYILPEN